MPYPSNPGTKRSSLGNARNHGSAKQGTGHWLHQRVSAIALILLVPWFLYSVLTEDMTSYQGVVNWLDNPGDLVFLILTLVAALYHGALGLQVIIEDYVHTNCIKFPMLVITNFLFIVLGVMAVYALISTKFFDQSSEISYSQSDQAALASLVNGVHSNDLTPQEIPSQPHTNEGR